MHPERTLREQFRLILDNLTDYAVFFIGIDGMIQSWHPGVRSVLGYEEQDFVGQPLSIIYTDEARRLGADREDVVKARDQGRAGNDTWHVRADRSHIFVFGLLAPLRTPEGDLVGYVKILRDRTEHLRSIQELERERHRADEASREKDAFIAVISHELRTPINALRGWAHMALDGSISESQIRSALIRIARNSDRAARLLDDLRDVSRIVAGKLNLNLEPCDLARAAAETIEELEPIAVAKQIAIDLHVRRRAVIRADRLRLGQVLVNLLTNAVKYTPENGRVTVTVDVRDAQGELVVSDTGRGIEAADLPHIFNRFRRTEQTESDSLGLGLGLWVVCELVKVHGGSIEVASGGAGQGATFTVRWPSAQSPQRTSDASG